MATATVEATVGTAAEASSAQVPSTPEQTQASTAQPAVFKGPRKNLVTGVALTTAGTLAFVMGMGETFFAGATAWTFLGWGLLLIYADLLAMAETYTLTDEELVISNPFRWWGPTRRWAWQHVSRMEIPVRRNDPQASDLDIHLYYTPPDQPGVLHREDLTFQPELAKLILAKTKLKADRNNSFKELTQIPQNAPGTYLWS